MSKRKPTNTFVTENSTEAYLVTKFKGFKSWFKQLLSSHKKIITIVGIVVLVGVGICFALVNLTKTANTKKEPEVSLADKCHPNSAHSITKEAAIILDPTKNGSLKGLEKAIEPIKAEPGHEQDPNCLYPILRYYMAITDPENSKIYFDKFEAVYSKGFASDFYGFDLETLRASVKHLEVLAKEAESHRMYTDPVAPEDLVE